MGSTVSDITADNDAEMGSVVADNHCAGVTAVHIGWTDKDSPAEVLRGGVTAAT